MNGFEIGNRSLAVRAGTEARNDWDSDGQAEQVVQGRVIAVEDGDDNGYVIGVLDENGLALDIYGAVRAPEGMTLSVDELVSLKMDARSGVPRVLTAGGGGSTCAVGINTFGVATG